MPGPAGGRVKPLHVVDSYDDGVGSTEGRLFGRVRFMHADNGNTARAAAGRAAAESIWVPGTLLPEHGVSWRAESEDSIVAQCAVAPSFTCASAKPALCGASA